MYKQLSIYIYIYIYTCNICLIYMCVYIYIYMFVLVIIATIMTTIIINIICPSSRRRASVLSRSGKILVCFRKTLFMYVCINSVCMHLYLSDTMCCVYVVCLLCVLCVVSSVAREDNRGACRR